jgi:hypothetical protein
LHPRQSPEGNPGAGAFLRGFADLWGWGVVDVPEGSGGLALSELDGYAGETATPPRTQSRDPAKNPFEGYPSLRAAC